MSLIKHTKTFCGMKQTVIKSCSSIFVKHPFSDPISNFPSGSHAKIYGEEMQILGEGKPLEK